MRTSGGRAMVDSGRDLRISLLVLLHAPGVRAKSCCRRASTEPFGSSWRFSGNKLID